MSIDDLQKAGSQMKLIKHKTILIIDEDFAFLSSIQNFLEQKKYLTIGFTR